MTSTPPGAGVPRATAVASARTALDAVDEVLSAVGGFIAAAWDEVVELWLQDRPRRRMLRGQRRRRWWSRGGLWRALVVAEFGLVAGWVVGRSAWQVVKLTPRVARAGRQGASRARARARESARERRFSGQVIQGEAWPSGRDAPGPRDRGARPRGRRTGPRDGPVPGTGNGPGVGRPVDPRSGSPVEPVVVPGAADADRRGRGRGTAPAGGRARPGRGVQVQDGGRGPFVALVEGAGVGPAPTGVGVPGGPVRPTEGKEPEVSVMQRTSLGGELAGPADLKAQAVHVQALLEQARVAEAKIAEWQGNLATYVSGASWGTGPLKSTSASLSQTPVGELREHLPTLTQAVAEAKRLGELLGSVGAQGDMRALGE